MKKMFQRIYLIIFLITGIGIAGNIDLGIKTNPILVTVMIISGALCIGKIVYCNIYYPNKIYLWK